MPEIFVIADTHFGHKKIIEFEPSRAHFSCIEEHDEFIVDQWNSIVTKRDTVIHLGDVLFGKESFQTLGRLNGLKRLVLGNHDNYPITEYTKYFNSIHGSFKKGDVIMTHIPIHQYQLEERFRLNIHGHMHSKNILGSYCCVSVERTNFQPVPFEVFR